jgi:hypothetical protein
MVIRVLGRREVPGRVYTLEVTCVDAAGNRALATTRVIVPHDQRRKK